MNRALPVLALMLFSVLPACEKEPDLHLVKGEIMGTTFMVKALSSGVPPDAGQDMPGAVMAALRDVDNRMSTYKAQSELSRFNQHLATTPFEFSAETFEVIDRACAISRASHGAFDITVGPLVNAWGFGPDGKHQGPSDDELAGLRARVGYENLVLDPAKRTVAKKRPDIYCDLAAIAKGYGVDQVARVLDGLGFEHYMVEVGGEVRTKGENVRGEAWRIAIEKPVSDRRDVQEVLALSGLALATSGDYRNYYEVDGRRLSHTIDPATGRPIEHRLASVSVVADECVDADAWATALMVLGPEKGYDVAQREGLRALFIVREAPETFVEKVTESLRPLLKARGADAEAT